MKGKRKCETLKAIRLEIAKAYNINYTPRQCNHKGDCNGTCPACEQEVMYIEQQIKNNIACGKAIAITSVATSIIALSACDSQPQTYQIKESDSIVYANEEKGPLDTVYHIKPCAVAEKQDSANSITTIVAQPKNAKTTETKHLEHHDNAEDDEEADVCGMIHYEPPYFEGGLDSLKKFIKTNVVYPKQALEEGISGKVIVKFEVTPNGKIDNVEIRRSIHPALDEEAIRVVKLMEGKWESKTRHNYKLGLPIAFILSSETSEDSSNEKGKRKIKKAEFKGDKGALRKFILENMQYPDYEFDNDIEGIAKVTFTIMKNGDVKNVKINKSTGNQNLDNEAIRLIKLTSGKWDIPSEYGNAKEIENTIAIRFTTWAEYE